MASPTESSAQRTRLTRVPSGPRPVSSASGRTITPPLSRQSSVRTVREEDPFTDHQTLTVDPPHTRRISFTSTAASSRFSTYSGVGTLPSVEGEGFEILSQQFDQLMRGLDKAGVTPAPVSNEAVTVSRAPTTASRATTARRSPLAPPMITTTAPSPLPRDDSPTFSGGVTEEATVVPVVQEEETFHKGHRRRTSSCSSGSTLAPETPSDVFTVSAFPHPPTTAKLDYETMPPTPPAHARMYTDSAPVPTTMLSKSFDSPYRKSWTGSDLYVDPLHVPQIKKVLQPDLEAQVEDAEDRARRSCERIEMNRRTRLSTVCIQLTIPVFVLALIGLIIWIVIRYR